MTNDIRALTERYVEAFHTRDLAGVAAIMAEDFKLSDPDNDGLTPRDNVLSFIQQLFDNAGPTLSFVAKHILVDGNRSAIEFELTIGASRFEGVDIIDWQDGKMQAMRAYLTPKQ